MKYILVILGLTFFLGGCELGNKNKEILEGRIWRAKSGETAIIYFQETDKTVYMWNAEISSSLRNDPNFSAKGLIEPKGTPETNKFPDDKEQDVRVGWEPVGGYKILNDTFYLSIENSENAKKFHIAKVYDTLIKEDKYKAIQMYRYDGRKPKPVKFLSKEE